MRKKDTSILYIGLIFVITGVYVLYFGFFYQELEPYDILVESATLCISVFGLLILMRLRYTPFLVAWSLLLLKFIIDIADEFEDMIDYPFDIDVLEDMTFLAALLLLMYATNLLIKRLESERNSKLNHQLVSTSFQDLQEEIKSHEESAKSLAVVRIYIRSNQEDWLEKHASLSSANNHVQSCIRAEFPPLYQSIYNLNQTELVMLIKNVKRTEVTEKIIHLRNQLDLIPLDRQVVSIGLVYGFAGEGPDLFKRAWHQGSKLQKGTQAR